jgi:hypothetical protein
MEVDFVDFVLGTCLVAVGLTLIALIVGAWKWGGEKDRIVEETVTTTVRIRPPRNPGFLDDKVLLENPPELDYDGKGRRKSITRRGFWRYGWRCRTCQLLSGGRDKYELGPDGCSRCEAPTKTYQYVRFRFIYRYMGESTPAGGHWVKTGPFIEGIDPIAMPEGLRVACDYCGADPCGCGASVLVA